MKKSELVSFLFGNETPQIQEELPETLWACNSGPYHSNIHVVDRRDGEIINLINYGKKISLIE